MSAKHVYELLPVIERDGELTTQGSDFIWSAESKNAEVAERAAVDDAVQMMDNDVSINRVKLYHSHPSPGPQRRYVRVYVASSWRNGQQPAVVAALRAAGHEVYDFREPRQATTGSPGTRSTRPSPAARPT
jgi:hypothetical protein